MPYFVHGCGLICVRKKYTDLLLWHLVRTFSVSMLEVLHSSTRDWGSLLFCGRVVALPKRRACSPEWVSASEKLLHPSANSSRVSQHQDGWAKAQGLMLVLPAPWAVPATDFLEESFCLTRQKCDVTAQGRMCLQVPSHKRTEKDKNRCPDFVIAKPLVIQTHSKSLPLPMGSSKYLVWFLLSRFHLEMVPSCWPS